MASQKQKFLALIPLFLLLSFSSLVLIYLSPSNPNPQIQPLLRHVPASSPSQNFTFIIKVLTFNRLSSLSRCLNSLAKANYDGDRVHLHILIDHFPIDFLNDSSDLDQKLDLQKRILDFVDEFRWKFGEKVVHFRTTNAGLQAQWLEAWWPSSDDEFAFVVEDDLEVSPLYYRFLKAVILQYYYNATNFSPSIYGASLQRPRFVPGKHGNKMQLDGEARIFLYQLVGTWGQLLFPRPWKEFRLWYDAHKAKGMKPFLDGMVTTGWYKKIGEKIWTPWFIKFTQSRGYFNIYTNFLQSRALSTSHRDAGVNYGKTVGPDSSLIKENPLDFNLLDVYPLKDLKWYDFCFREVYTNRIISTSKTLDSVLQDVQKKKSVIVVSLYAIPEMIQEATIRNMLCRFDMLNIRNYVLVGPTSDFLLDLARRGHRVIDAGQFSDFSKLPSSFNSQDPNVEMVKEILVKTNVIKKSLELGFDTWMVDGNMVPFGNDSFFDSFHSTTDFFIGKSARVLFVRSSPYTRKIWNDDFVYKVAKQLSPGGSGLISGESALLSGIENLLERQGTKFENLDKTSLCLDIGNQGNSSSISGETKFVFWFFWREVDVIQKQLGKLNMWSVDSDLSCTAVVCQRS